MARLYPLVAALLLCALATTFASAQSLQRLTVTQLTLSASTLTPRVEVPFDLIVTAHVRERVTRLENLDLPILAEVELLGDEQSVVSDAGGSSYTERIRVVAHHSGTITIAPVTLDAVDARDGKPKRYSSNALTLHVVAAGLTGPGSSALGSDAWPKLLRALQTFFFIALLIVAAVIVVLILRARARRPAARPVAPPPAPAPVPPPPSASERLRAAADALRREPSRANVLHVRTIARAMVGANDEETLEDVLRRTPAHDVRERSLLRALERAAFTYETDFQAAVDDVLRRLEEMT